MEAIATKAWVRDHLRSLTAELAEVDPIPEPDLLADQLMIIVEGVYATVQSLGAQGPARTARGLAAKVLGETEGRG